MLCFVFAVLVVLLDQFFKHWILLTLAVKEDMQLLPGIIGLTNEPNTGAAFSILSGQRWLLVGIACVAAIFIIAILLRYNYGFWGTLGLAAVLGGTVGNLIDRIFVGQVVDMFELYFVNFAIFNVADIFITLGGITFLFASIASIIKPSKKPEMLSGAASAEPARVKYEPIEDQIGLYDFQFGEEPDNRERYGYDDIPAAEPVSSGYPEPEIASPVYVPDSGAYVSVVEPPGDHESTLSALSALESELRDLGALEDYDLDELLREYGFEDDKD